MEGYLLFNSSFPIEENQSYLNAGSLFSTRILSYVSFNSIEIQGFSFLSNLLAGHVKPRSSGHHQKHKGCSISSKALDRCSNF